MRLAICNETFADRPLADACEVIRRLGYEGIELAPFTLTDNIYALSDHERNGIRQTIGDAGLQTVGLHWLLARTSGLHLISEERAVQKATARYLCELARLCRDIGGKVLVFGSPQQRRLPASMSQETGIESAAGLLQQVLPVLEETQVVLAIEPLSSLECNFLPSAAHAAQLVERIAHPQVRMILDAKAMAHEDRPIPDIIRTHASKLAHFHVNDPNLLGPGMGSLDFAPILSALHAMRYQGWMSVEVFDLTPGPEQIADSSIKYLHRILKTLEAQST